MEAKNIELYGCLDIVVSGKKIYVVRVGYRKNIY
jgi:hypothetical protein